MQWAFSLTCWERSNAEQQLRHRHARRIKGFGHFVVEPRAHRRFGSRFIAPDTTIVSKMII